MSQKSGLTGEELMSWMKANFISVQDLSGACGVPKSTVNGWAYRTSRRMSEPMRIVAAGAALLMADKEHPGSAFWVRQKMHEHSLSPSSMGRLLGLHKSMISEWRIHGIQDDDVLEDVVQMMREANHLLVGCDVGGFLVPWAMMTGGARGQSKAMRHYQDLWDQDGQQGAGAMSVEVDRKLREAPDEWFASTTNEGRATALLTDHDRIMNLASTSGILILSGLFAIIPALGFLIATAVRMSNGDDVGGSLSMAAIFLAFVSFDFSIGSMLASKADRSAKKQQERLTMWRRNGSLR